MSKIYLTFLVTLLLAAIPLPAPGADPASATISVESEGKVLATPDMANLILEVETQTASAQAAGTENARLSEGLLQALKKALAPEEKVQSLGYRLTPVRAAKDKTRPAEITGYQAVNRFQVKVRRLDKLGAVIDTALANGASRVNGPYWAHSRQEDLQREAAVEALGRARRLAEALAQGAGVKIKGLKNLSTGIRYLSPRAAAEPFLAARGAAPPTPVEVGEEEIKAAVTAVFELAP
jgi:uncharacterized protein